MMPNAFELYLVRHAIAADRGEAWPDDSLRPLTRDGIRRFKAVTRALAVLDVELDAILTSPLVRAKQTAELLAAGLSRPPTVRVMKALTPGTQLDGVVRSVLRLRRGRVALVGHEPDLGRLAAALIGARRALHFRKGGVCRIDVQTVPPLRGDLVWFSPPALLRNLGRH